MPAPLPQLSNRLLWPDRFINPDLNMSWRERLRLLPHLHVLVQLKHFETRSRKQIRCYQKETLARLIYFAANNIPFYKDRFGRVPLRPSPSSLEALLSRLPITTRQDMSRAFPEGFASPGSSRAQYALEDSTSGTTGTPFRFYKDFRSSPYEHYRRSLFRMELGLPYHTVELIVKGHTRPFQSDSPFLLKDSPYRLRVDGFAISHRNIDRVLKFIQAHQVRLISGYPSSVDNLFHLAYEKGVRLPVTHVITTGEALAERQKKFWEKRFKVRVSEIYGTAECMHIAFRCPEGQGYHVDEQRYIVELCQQRRVKDGVYRGQLVITDLKNEVMPFIRYNLGDWVWLTETPCSCGSRVRRILTVEPREQDQVETPSGKILDLRFFIDEILWEVSSDVRQFQVVCRGKCLELRLKTCNGPLPASRERSIQQALESYVDHSMVICIRYNEPFVGSRSGKHKYLVNLSHKQGQRAFTWEAKGDDTQ